MTSANTASAGATARAYDRIVARSGFQRPRAASSSRSSAGSITALSLANSASAKSAAAASTVRAAGRTSRSAAGSRAGMQRARRPPRSRRRGRPRWRPPRRARDARRRAGRQPAQPGANSSWRRHNTSMQAAACQRTSQVEPRGRATGHGPVGGEGEGGERPPNGELLPADRPVRLREDGGQVAERVDARVQEDEGYVVVRESAAHAERVDGNGRKAHEHPGAHDGARPIRAGLRLPLRSLIDAIHEQGVGEDRVRLHLAELAGRDRPADRRRAGSWRRSPCAMEGLRHRPARSRRRGGKSWAAAGNRSRSPRAGRSRNS